MAGSVFRDDAELLAFAARFLTQRTESLYGDAVACRSGGGGFFPIVLYAFATIDLLGSAAAGNATKGGGLSKRARDYMTTYMQYTPDEARLLQEVLRHKLVHLAQPAPVVADGGRLITWQLWPDDASQHRQLVPHADRIPLASGLVVVTTHRFNLSLKHFVTDVCDSVTDRHRGYLAELTAKPGLRSDFERAMEQLHDPTN